MVASASIVLAWLKNQKNPNLNQSIDDSVVLATYQFGTSEYSFATLTVWLVMTMLENDQKDSH